jgi:thymidylate synthase (FAD)
MEKKINLVAITHNAEDIILQCARVSSSNPNSKDKKLIRYLKKHGHWSPFEMATCCISIKTSRTIARQILRHKSFSFQEFSQRYQSVSHQPDFIHWEARTEHEKNRQSSVAIHDPNLQAEFTKLQQECWDTCNKAYQHALSLGIAKEQARCVLPEGLTETHMYMSGTIRSWIHYIELRTKEDTQEEHRLVALECREILKQQCPHIFF